MAIEIIVLHKNSNEISDIVKEIKLLGFIIGKDFDFAYTPGRYDYNDSKDIPRQTKFICYNEKLATWISLKWI